MTEFPASDFDAWAEEYDTTVFQESAFPFKGYRALLDEVFKMAAAQPRQTVLDLGTGTGNQAALFAQAGCILWCSDFSAMMMQLAKIKLPDADFVLYDLHDQYPVSLPLKFDRIVSAYTFHHFNIGEKAKIIERLLQHLSPGGSITIGDIAFADEQARQMLRHELGEGWEEEYYWVASNDLPAFKNAGIMTNYRAISDFLGVFHLQRKE